MQGQVLASTGQQRFNSIMKTIHFAHLVIILFIYDLTATKGLDWRIRRGWVAEITSYLFFQSFQGGRGGEDRLGKELFRVSLVCSLLLAKVRGACSKSLNSYSATRKGACLPL